MLFRFIRDRPLMAAKLRKMAKSPVLFPPPGGGGNNTMLFRFIRVRGISAEILIAERVPISREARVLTPLRKHAGGMFLGGRGA